LSNPAFEKITGYSAQELYNPDFNFQDIVLPEDINKITDNKKDEQNKIEGRYDFRVLAKNDSIKNVEVRTVDIGKKDVRIMGIMRDISKRKQVEEDLRIQNLRYQNLIENELTGIGITDFNENLIFVNPTFADILGYSVEELEGMNLSELTTEKEYKKFLKENEKRKKNKESVYETELIHKDGRLVDIIINASPHKDSDGKIIGTVGVIIDITEKKRAEKIALEREKWFKVLSDTISSAIFVFRDNKFVYVNRAAQKLTEYSGRELLNMNFWDPIHPDFQKSIKNKVLKLKDKEQVSERIEFKIVTRNDQEKWVDFRSGRINWEEKPAIIGTAVDITDRKRIEQNLRESEEKFKMITNNTSSMVAILDSNGNYEYASPSHKSILGYTPQELMGQNAFEIITPEARSKLFELLKKGMSGEINRVSKLEYETYDKEGNLHYLEGSFDSIRDENDNLQKIINISDDITRRKKNEEERKKLEKQLQQAQKMESIGRLAGGVAHDLNNILTPILGYAELLQDSFSQSDERNNLVKQIIKSGDRAKNIVHQLLAFSRKQALEVKPINLNNVISRFKKLLRRTIKENIEINVNLAKPLPKIEADIGQIEQVIMNLSVNAQDAMPDGGKLTIATKLTQLDGAYSATHQNFQPGKYVCLSISDTGFGMDSETQSQIFEPFFSTKGDQGTGLGLATVYGIIKQHNGDINVYSEPGRGTTFKIYLPAIKKDIKKESQKKQRTITATGGAETILLVEDNPQVRNLAHQVLKNQGYHVLVKRDGKEALEIIRGHEEPIDLLLTDVVMPEMSGKELYTRALENYPDLKVLYMSGYTEDVIDHHGILNEGINFIQKPFSILKLATRVREILDQ
jgi:PAS domain S-box-containing protein